MNLLDLFEPMFPGKCVFVLITRNNRLRIFDYVPNRGNARFYQCMLDEDLIRRVALLVYQHFFFTWGT